MKKSRVVKYLFGEFKFCSKAAFTRITITNYIFFNVGTVAKGLTIDSLEVLAAKSSNVNLSCWIDYDFFCPETLLWKFNDKPEPLPKSGKKYNAELKDTNSKCQKEFILSIFNVTEFDEGTYSCHWLCDYENTTKAAIDLKVFDDIPVLPLIIATI